MTRFQRFTAAACLSLGLTACMAATPPVEVTRFHNIPATPIGQGSVALTFADGDGRGQLEQGVYTAAVLRELQRVGFSDAGSTSETSAYIARLSVDQARITAGGRRSPVSVGVGGSTGSYGSGVGVGIGINLSGAPKDRIATELSVRLSKRADDSVVWEGRSSLEAKDGSPGTQAGFAAVKLAEALFRDFPGESGATIRVK